jgi:hypothetical protein
MNRLYAAVSLASLFLCLSGCGHNPGPDNRAAQAFARDSISIIGSTWDPDLFRARASPDTLTQETPETTRARFQLLDRLLGKLVELKAPQGGITSVFLSKDGLIELATFQAKAKFEKAPAVVTVQVEKLRGKWCLTFFHVEVVP